MSINKADEFHPPSTHIQPRDSQMQPSQNLASMVPAQEPEVTDKLSSPRACDRCFSLKTQCDFAEPCSRCKRLHLDCTTVRPIRPRGRPRKGASHLQHASHQPPTGTSESPDTVGGLPDLVSDQCLDPNLAATLLDYMTSSARSAGIYCILPTSIQRSPEFGDNGSQQLEDDYPFPGGLFIPSLTHSLLAVALELRFHSLPAADQDLSQLNIEWLRTSSLAQIPNISWKYQPHIADAISLVFLSFTWCFEKELCDISLRWNSLARVIVSDATRNHFATHLGTEILPTVLDLQRYTSMSISIQERVLFLLHYNLTLPLNQLNILKDRPSYPQEALDDDVSSCSVDNGTFLTESYFALFSPLASIAVLVLEEPVLKSHGWREVYDRLEDFFLSFPSHLLKFDDLDHAYQAEAMVWMHGLFIVHYTKRDLLDMLLEPQIITPEVFPEVLGHSLLLGEVLPVLERLNQYPENLSPAGVFFLLISCVVQIVALSQYSPVDEVMTEGEIYVPLEQTASVPQTLLDSSRRHLDILSAICDQCRRFNSPLLQEVKRLLETCYYCAVGQSFDSQCVPATVLMLYRWKGRGTGIAPLDESTALAEWGFSQSPEVDIRNYIIKFSEDSKRLTAKVCSPDSRICRPGHFDLSISIPE